MSPSPSARPDSGPDRATLLHDELARATEQVDALEAEYQQLLANPDVIQEDRDATAVLLQHARRTLDSAQAAVDRLDAGTDGRCSVCGGDIGAERLAALVDVTTCVGCAR